MAKPQKKYLFKDLDRFTDVEMVSNSYFIATINGEKGVVDYDENTDLKTLELWVNDTKMRMRKYTCRLMHPKIGSDWIYFKNPEKISEFLENSYPNLKHVNMTLIVKPR